MLDQQIEVAVPESEYERNNCFAFVRKIKNADLLHPDAEKFFEIDDDQLDEHARKTLKRRMWLVESRIPASHIFNFEIKWSAHEGINAVDHKTYLHNFAATFEREMRNRSGSCLAFLR